MLAIKPDNTDGLGNLGNALLRKDKLDEAMVCIFKERWQSSLMITPTDMILAPALLQKGRVDEAVLAFERALAIRPDLASSLQQPGAPLLFKKGGFDEAIVQFQKALAIQPGFVEAQGGLAHIAWVLATSPNPAVQSRPKPSNSPGKQMAFQRQGSGDGDHFGGGLCGSRSLSWGSGLPPPSALCNWANKPEQCRADYRPEGPAQIVSGWFLIPPDSHPELILTFIFRLD